jgi:hypothetical protein
MATKIDFMVSIKLKSMSGCQLSQVCRVEGFLMCANLTGCQGKSMNAES